MTHNSAITCGGMRGLKDLADGLVLGAKDLNTFHRFIQPDNSFGTCNLHLNETIFLILNF